MQLHPSQSCNLRCRHCYSESGPEHRGAIARGLIDRLLEDAWTEGFGYLSISGGEPLLWPDLFDVLAQARSMGYATALTTNGTLIQPGNVEQLTRVTDLVGVSVDGPRAEHEAMRGSTSAWTRMRRGMRLLAASGARFGVVFTLTQHNCHQIEALLDFCAESGAEYLQIHPLEPSGAARSLTSQAPDPGELMAAAWNVARLYQRALARGIDIRMGVTDTRLLARDPQLSGALEMQDELTSWRLSRILDALVVEPDAVVVPLSYGFDRQYAIGDLKHARLSELAERWRQRRLADYLALCRGTLTRVKQTGSPLVNWTYELRAAAQRAAVEQRSALTQLA